MHPIIDALNWRYATQKFDFTKKLSQEQLDTLLEAIRLAPSSYGLQPWRCLVITNKELRVKFRAVGFDQPKITDASHLFVFAVEKNIDAAFVDGFVTLIAKTRGVSEESVQEYGNMMKAFVNRKTPAELMDWAARQAYLALGVLVTTAALMKIDVGPMEGFDPKKFDEILDLERVGLASVVIAAAGFRDPSDPAAVRKKVRYPKDELFIHAP